MRKPKAVKAPAGAMFDKAGRPIANANSKAADRALAAGRKKKAAAPADDLDAAIRAGFKK